VSSHVIVIGPTMLTAAMPLDAATIHTPHHTVASPK